MKFAHLNISKKEVKKFNIRKLRRKFIFRILHTIERTNMSKFHSSYCASAVYDLMENRCILMSIGNYETGYDLILGKNFNKMLSAYRKKHTDHYELTRIEKFDPIEIMLFRRQVSEC